MIALAWLALPAFGGLVWLIWSVAEWAIGRARVRYGQPEDEA